MSERLGAEYLDGLGELLVTRSGTGRVVLVGGRMLFALDEARRADRG